MQINPTLWSWVIMKIMAGPRVIALHLSFDLTVFDSLSVWLFNAGVASNRAIVRMHFVKGTFLQMKLPMSVHHQATRILQRMSIGSFSKLSMGYAKVLNTGIKRSMLSSNPLVSSPHDPCFYTGFVWDSQNSLETCSSIPLSLGLNIDKFVYFSKDQAIEMLFKHLLEEQIQVNFMGLMEWFLSIHLSWHFTKFNAVVHLNQLGYAVNLAEHFCWDMWDPTDSIASSTNDNNPPA